MNWPTAADTHWWDRVGSAEPPPRDRRVVPLAGDCSRAMRAVINTRSALHARTGLTQEELYLLLCDRRHAVLQGSRPRRALLSLALLAGGTALSMPVGQPWLGCGLVMVLVGVVAGCTVLADFLVPPMGELVQYMRAAEQPADALEIGALSRAAQADPELSQLVAHWWKGCGAPIRKQDLALVQEFVRAKQNL